MKRRGKEGLELLKSSKPARVIAKYVNLIPKEHSNLDSGCRCHFKDAIAADRKRRLTSNLDIGWSRWRKRKNKLSAEHRKLLNKIGFVWRV